jgi:selenide,water dikinase
MKRLLLLGGGHSHIEVIRRFGISPPRDTRVVLASPERYTPYSGMLPGLVAGHYGFHDCHIDLERLCARAGIQFIRNQAVALDAHHRRVRFSDETDADFDFASIDVGSTPDVRATPGAAEHAARVKPVSAFLANWERFLAAALADARAPVLAIVGAGAGGVELALAMEYRIRAAGRQAARVHLLTDTAAILPAHPDRVRRMFDRILRQRAVEVHTRSRIVRVDRGILHRESGTDVAGDFIVWAVGAGAPEWTGQSGLVTDGHGFIMVDQSLRSLSHPRVFAAGDVASVIDHPRPKAGVYAVRQGPVLAENLRRALADRPLLAYTPQKAVLALISAGDRYAVASWNGLALEGGWVWRWKDYIDRRFIAKYAVR